MLNWLFVAAASAPGAGFDSGEVESEPATGLLLGPEVVAAVSEPASVLVLVSEAEAVVEVGEVGGLLGAEWCWELWATVGF